MIKINLEHLMVTDKRINKYEFGMKISQYLKLNKHLIIKTKINQMNLIVRPKSMFLKNNKIKKILKFKSDIYSNFKYI